MDRRDAISGLGMLLGGAIIGPRVDMSLTHPKKPTEKTGSARRKKILTGWKFQADIKNVGENEKWFTKKISDVDWSNVIVPQAWDCYEEGLWEYEGIGWYMTAIEPGDFTPGSRLQLIFQRVMYYSKVWLNGEYIGENIGGYLPFDFNITRHAKPGIKNTLVLRVDNKPRIEWLPAGKQIEWIQYGGILQNVELTTTPEVYLEDMIIRTDPGDGTAQIGCIISVANETGKDALVEVEVTVARNKAKFNKKVSVQATKNDTVKVTADITLHQPDVWSPESPALYTARATLKRDGKVIDDLSDRFGIRKITVEGTSILLNGKPIEIKGVNRYDDYGRMGPTVPENILREDLTMMKSAGINFIRMHYPQSPELLSLYDEYGFMMMEEIPMCWWGVQWFGETTQSLDILKFAKPALSKMIARDKNHPAIIFWSMANESQTDSTIGIAVMRDLLKQAKSLDPTRLATFVVAGNPDGHLAFDDADIICINKYNGIFGDNSCNHFSDIDRLGYEPFVKELKQHRSKYIKPIVIAEFGAQGIKNIHGDISYSEEFQSAYIERIWQGIKSVPGVSGGVLWCWADYFHRKYFITYTAYGPYGAVTFDRKPKRALESVTKMYGGSKTKKQDGHDS